MGNKLPLGDGADRNDKAFVRHSRTSRFRRAGSTVRASASSFEHALTPAQP
jgi:hypothetical protein